MGKNIVIAVLLSVILCGCNFEPKIDSNNLPSSSGKYGEVLVVIDSSYNKGQLKQSLDSIFLAPLVGLPQMEPQFRTSFVIPKGFKSILKRARNILKVSIKKGSKLDVEISNNIWAKDQLLIRVIAPTVDDANRVLTKNTQTIRDYFNEKEINRLQLRHKEKLNKKFKEVLKRKYKLSLDIPPGFIKMMDSTNGVWFKKEKQIGQHLVMQGISIYSEDYLSDSLFKKESMIESRNIFTKDFIQGSRDNSFMTVYNEFSPAEKEVNLNSLYSKEFRGLWKMENDFMGGPFLHYVFLNKETNQLVHLDGFVYAPNFNKREYLRELEAILKSINLN